MTRPAILDRARAAGAVVFTGGDHDANLIAERLTLEPLKYADRMHLVYLLGGSWVWHQWACDTVAHPDYLRTPLHPGGTPLLEPGQHRGAFALGDHKGRSALVPTRALPVRRVQLRDGTVGALGEVELALGIRIHDGDRIAGCIGMPTQHKDALLAALAPCFARWGPTVSLTLLAP